MHNWKYNETPIRDYLIIAVTKTAKIGPPKVYRHIHAGYWKVDGEKFMVHEIDFYCWQTVAVWELPIDSNT